MNILLTGAASGIGNALFKEYQSLGHHIYGIDFQEMNPEEHLTFFQADIQNQKRLEEIRSLLAEQNIKLDKVGFLITRHLIIKRRIALSP